MATITNTVRWAHNTDALKQAVMAGIGTIDAMKTAVDRTAASLGGQGLFMAANRAVAAIGQLGDVNKLTASEQARMNDLLDKAIEKYKLMGMTVPPVMQEMSTALAKNQAQLRLMQGGADGASTGIGGLLRGVGGLRGLLGTLGLPLTAAAFVGMAKGAMDSADALMKLHEKTSISTDDLQRLQMAGDDTGNSLEDLAGGVTKLQKNIADGSDGTKAALSRLGLELATLRSLSTFDQFTAVGDAIAKIEDPAERVALAMQLMGRTGADLLPTLTRGFDDVRNASVGMSKEAVRALDDVGDAMTRAYRTAKGAIGEGVSLILRSTRDGAFYPLVEAAREVGDQLDAMAKHAQQAAPKMGAVIPGGLPADLDAINAKWKVQEHDLLASAKAAEAHTRALDAVNKKIGDATASYAPLTVAQQETILKFQTLGLSTGEIALKMGIAERAVKDYEAHHKTLSAQLLDVEGRTDKLTLKTVPLGAALDAMGKHLPLPQLKDLSGYALSSASDIDGLRVKSDDLKRAGRFLTDEMVKVNKEIATLPSVTPGAKTALADLRDGADRAGTSLGAGLKEALKDFPSTLSRALEGGGSLKGAISSLAAQLGGVFAADLSAGLAAGLGGGGAAAGMGAMVGAGAALSGGSIGSQFATAATASLGASAAAWTTTGATLGASLAVGMTTMGIGAAVIGIVAWVRWMGDALKRDFENLGRSWGVNISEGLAEELQSQVESGLFSTELAAMHSALARVIQEAGGLNTSNLDMFTSKLRDTFSLVERGELTTGQAANILNANWAAFVAQGTDGNGRLSAGLKEIIQLNERFGTQSKEIAQYVQAQASTAIGAFAAIMAGTLDAARGYDAVRTAVDNASTAVDAAKQKVDVLAAAGKTGTTEHKLAVDQLTQAMATQANALTAQSIAQDAAKESLTDLGLQALATFNAAVAGGMSVPEAMKQIGPSVTALSEQYQALGLSVDDVALRNLMFSNELVTKNPQLINAVSGLTNQMIAMDNIGKETVDLFAAQQRTGYNAYLSIQGAVAAMGGTTEDALSQMQTFLQQAAIEAKNLGVPLDDNTQRLIDQSKELGLWQETGKTANEELVDAFNGVGDSMQASFGMLAGKIGEFTDQIVEAMRALGDLRTTEPSLKVVESGLQDATEAAGWLADTVSDAAKNIRTMPTVPASVIGSIEDLEDAALGAAGAINAVSFGSSPGGIKEIPIQLAIAESATHRWRDRTRDDIDDVVEAVNRAGDEYGRFREELARPLEGPGSLLWDLMLDRLRDHGEPLPERESFRERDRATVFGAAGLFVPRGSDVVPAMLSPGEWVLSPEDSRRLERLGGLSALRSGSTPRPVVDLSALVSEFRALRADNARIHAQLMGLPDTMRRAVRDAVLIATS